MKNNVEKANMGLFVADIGLLYKWFHALPQVCPPGYTFSLSLHLSGHIGSILDAVPADEQGPLT